MKASKDGKMKKNVTRTSADRSASQASAGLSKLGAGLSGRGAGSADAKAGRAAAKTKSFRTAAATAKGGGQGRTSPVAKSKPYGSKYRKASVPR